MPKCYKMVKRISGQNEYSSLLWSNAEVSYKVGQTTESLAGPLFAYYTHKKASADSLKYTYTTFSEVGSKPEIFECEYIPFENNVKRMMSPLFIMYLTLDEIKDFWNGGHVCDKIAYQANFDAFIESKTDYSDIYALCKSVTPLRIIILEEVYSNLLI